MTKGLPVNFYNMDLELVPMDSNIFYDEKILAKLEKLLAIEIQEVIHALESEIKRNPSVDYSELRLKLYNYYNQYINNLTEEREYIQLL